MMTTCRSSTLLHHPHQKESMRQHEGTPKREIVPDHQILVSRRAIAPTSNKITTARQPSIRNEWLLPPALPPRRTRRRAPKVRKANTSPPTRATKSRDDRNCMARSISSSADERSFNPKSVFGGIWFDFLIRLPPPIPPPPLPHLPPPPPPPLLAQHNPNPNPNPPSPSPSAATALSPPAPCSDRHPNSRAGCYPTTRSE